MVTRCLVRPMVPMITLAFSLAFLFDACPAVASPQDIIIYGGCSQTKFLYGSPYHSALTSIFIGISNSVYLYNYKDFSVASTDSPAAPISAIYQCRADLPTPACAQCIKFCINQLVSNLCPAATGAFIQLEGCFLKYDNVPGLVGTPDKTFKAKRCGWPGSIYPGMAERRDEVLTKLATSTDLYRVGRVEEVMGTAQCTGDLTASECDDCVKAAGDTLRGVCPVDSMGSVYLGKCYARFKAAGPPSPIRGPNDNVQSGNTASIIGLYFGLPLLIIILIPLAICLCCRYCKRGSFSDVKALILNKFRRKEKPNIDPKDLEIGSDKGDKKDGDGVDGYGQDEDARDGYGDEEYEDEDHEIKDGDPRVKPGGLIFHHCH